MQEQAHAPQPPAMRQEPQGLIDRFGDELVVGAGILTTGLSLGLVYLINANTDDFNIMGFYLWFILPVGAIAVGLGAGAGYGLASWFSGVKVSGALLAVVSALLVGGYFLAQYVQFKSLGPLQFNDGTAVGFWAFFDLMTQSQGYAVDGKTVSESLGLLGYGLRALEIAGFTGGGLIIPIAMMKKPYCNACRRYMNTRQLALFPASIGDKKPKKKDTEGIAAWEQATHEAWEAGHGALSRLFDAGAQGNVDDARAVLAEHQPGQKAYNKLPVRLAVALSSCKSCHDGFLSSRRVSGQGNQIQIEQLDKRAVTREVAAALA